MTRFGIGVLCAAAAALIGACTHDTYRSGSAAGEIATDSMPSSPNAVVVRVQNNYPTGIRVYAEANEDTSLVADVAAGETQTVSLNRDFLKYSLTTFEIRPVSDTLTTRIGPFNFFFGDRARIVVAPNLDSTHVYLHENW